MKTSLTRAMIAVGAAVLTGVAACERSSQPPAAQGGSSTTQPAILPATLFLAAEPEGVQGVHDAKGAAKQGDRVVVRGRIGGGDEPFIAERAVFTIVDPGVKSCKDMGEDHCATPWDYCCETPESLVANSATIQVVGADGKPLKTGLRGVRGLDPLAEVSIVGTVAQRDEEGTFVVNAEGVWIKPAGG